MDFQTDDSDFCWGHHELAVDDGPRIRLPSPVQYELVAHGEKAVWTFDVPRDGRRLIICPDGARKRFTEWIMKRVKPQVEGAAWRRYVCASSKVTLKRLGRVPIGSSIRREFIAKAGDTVVLLGVGPWYELWQHDDWLEDSRLL